MKALIGTRKGLFRIERRKDGWRIGEPRFLGVPIVNAVHDPRDGSIWACAGHGHWGAKLYVSHDDGVCKHPPYVSASSRDNLFSKIRCGLLRESATQPV